MLHKKDNSPIRYAKICRAEDKEIPYTEIVKGFEYAKDNYVVLTEQDFSKASVKSTHSIDIFEFIDQKEIDIRYYDRPYYLEPGKGADKAYLLLREVLRRSKKIAVATFVLHNREHLGVIKPDKESCAERRSNPCYFPSSAAHGLLRCARNDVAAPAAPLLNVDALERMRAQRALLVAGDIGAHRLVDHRMGDQEFRRLVVLDLLHPLVELGALGLIGNDAAPWRAASLNSALHHFGMLLPPGLPSVQPRGRRNCRDRRCRRSSRAAPVMSSPSCARLRYSPHS